VQADDVSDLPTLLISLNLFSRLHRNLSWNRNGTEWDQRVGELR